MVGCRKKDPVGSAADSILQTICQAEQPIPGSAGQNNVVVIYGFSHNDSTDDHWQTLEKIFQGQKKFGQSRCKIRAMGGERKRRRLSGVLFSLFFL